MKIETKIGVFVATGLLSLFILVSQVSTSPTSSEDGAYTVKTKIPDASGLTANTKVFMNGIKVGEVLTLNNNGSEVDLTLSISGKASIPNDSSLTITQESLMGRKIINILGGKSAHNLHNNDSLTNIKKISSFEELSTNATNLINKIDKPLTNSITNISLSSKKLPIITDKADSILTKIDSIATNLDKNIPEASNKLIKIENQVSEVIAENKVATKDAIVNAGAFFDEGKRAVAKINTIIDTLNLSTLEIAMNTNYMVRDSYTKVDVGFVYNPNSTTKYLFDIVTKDNYSEEGKVGLHQEGELLFSAQYSKRFNDLSFRFGAMESTGGLGLDYHLQNDSLKISADIYDFDSLHDYRATKPHLRLQMRYSLLDNIELFTGTDDSLNSKSSNIFFGIGVRFIDNDLKYALGAANLAR